MLNYNWNTLYTNRVTIAPILANTFDYLIVGGGGGAAAGGGAIGGNGGAGGSVVSGSFSFNHLTSATLNVGNGGVGGLNVGLNGSAGTASSIVYKASTIATAAGGAAGTNSTSNRGGITSTIDSAPTIGDYVWAQNGTKGGDSPVGVSGIGGGTGNQVFPWGTSPQLFTQTAFTNSGGGGGGFTWGSYNNNGATGNGANGMCMLRFYDPRDVFMYTGDWSVFVYQNGYKYFYFQNTGTFTFLGKRD